MTRLLRAAVRDRAIVFTAAVALALLSASQLYITWLIKDWVEGPVLGRGPSQLAPLLARALVAAAIGMISLFVSRYALASAGQRLVERLRNDAMDAILRARVEAVRSAPSGEWLSRLFNDVNVLSNFLGTVARRAIAETIILCGSLVLMFVLSWRLALAMVVLVPCTGWALVRIGRRIRAWGTSSQEAAATLTSVIGEQLAGFTTIKAFQAEPRMRDQVRRHATALRRRVLRAELWSATLIAIVFLIGGAALIAILIVGTAEVRRAAIDQATFLAFCLYAGQTVEPARRLSEVHALLQQSLAAAARVFAVIDLGPAEDAGVVARAPLGSGSLRFACVTFGYRDGQEVLRDLTFLIADGELAGIVGASGCGKSTVARLVAGFDDPRAGRIEIDGRDVRAIARRDLREAVCVVEQDPFVFSGPLLDNLRLGRPDATREVVDAAVAMTGLDALIATLPHGIDTPLREAGRDLSGGQQQRIALARAVVRDPRLLILDEAMSAIDSESEAATFAAMLPWLRKRTVIVVSHRLATIVRLPRVLLIDRGAIAADGNPHRLLDESPLFRMLFADQLEQMRRPA